jgi:mannitol-1-/sugar-/sorbitol-6-phosphatase
MTAGSSRSTLGRGPERLAIALDLDGTLLDLPVDIEPARAEIGALLAAAGHPGPPSPILAAIAAAVAAAGPDGRDLRRRALAVLDRAELVAAPGAVARAGAADLLAAVAAAGRPLAIVTDNGRACVGPALAAAGLRARFTLVARDDVALGKPAPDGLIAAARALLPGGGALLWAGDSPRDVAAGRAARASLPDVVLTVVAIGGRGRAVDAALLAAGPDQLCQGLAELVALVG